MGRALVTTLLCLHLLYPIAAQAQAAVAKTPLSYTLQQYAAVLGFSLLGGFASWWIKVRKGEVLVWNITTLIGELCISAFAGLMAFFICEYANVNPLLTPAVIGMAGHAGAKGISWLETIGKNVISKKFEITTTKD